MTIAFKFALIGALVAATSAFSSNRRNGENDEIEENEKHILNSNNFNRLFIIIESLMPESTTPSPLENQTDPTEESSSEEDFDEKDPDPLSVVWYLGAFGGLIAFFLVVTFSEWCCASKHLYRRQVLQGPYTFSESVNCAPQTPPPPYHLFAPPPYEVVSSDKTQFPILIVPIHKPTNPEQG